MLSQNIDLNENFSVSQLDQVVDIFYNGSGSDQVDAQRILTKFQDNPDSWLKVDQILQLSKVPQSKFIGLSILDKLIRTRWKTLPSEQRRGIRDFLVGMILYLSQMDTQQQTSFQVQELINKADLSLVQILKQEWPRNWPEFVQELITSSYSSLQLCENNLTILRLMAEEMLDFSSGDMTHRRIQYLRDSLSGEINRILEFVISVLANGDTPSQSLQNTALRCLLQYLNWISPRYLAASNVLELLAGRYLDMDSTRGSALRCLTEMVNLNVAKIDEDRNLFTKSMSSFEIAVEKVIKTVSTLTTDSLPSADQELLREITLFLTSYMTRYREYYEKNEQSNSRELILLVHGCILSLTKIDSNDRGNHWNNNDNDNDDNDNDDNKEIFKICIDYWHDLTRSLFEEVQNLIQSEEDSALGSLISGGYGAVSSNILRRYPLKVHMYADFCHGVAQILVNGKMERPEEIIVIEDEETGEMVKEVMRDSDTLQLYQTEREILIYLTNLDLDAMKLTILSGFETQIQLLNQYIAVDSTNCWSWRDLNSLCWATGSIAGSMREEDEQIFVKRILELLNEVRANEMKHLRDEVMYNSCFLYIVSQYPRFMKNNWSFLLNVLERLLQAMHSSNEGIQDMACDAFLKIAESCKYQLTVNDPRHLGRTDGRNTSPYIQVLVGQIANITRDLNPAQTQLVYKVCGLIIAEERDVNLRNKLLDELMEQANSCWDNFFEEFVANNQFSFDAHTVKSVGNILKINTGVCDGMGYKFHQQFKRINFHMLLLYKKTSVKINEGVQTNGPTYTRAPETRRMRVIKKHIIGMYETFISKSDMRDYEEIIKNYINPLLTLVLVDYNDSVPDARDYDVLRCMTTVIKKFGEKIPQGALFILEHTFNCTLDMINKNFEAYPDHRIEFYRLLRAINWKCFHVLLEVPSQDFFGLFFDAVCWAFKHQDRDVEQLGLQIAVELLRNIENLEDSSFSATFYQSYYLTLIGETISVMTDPDHKAAFAKQAILLQGLLKIVYEDGDSLRFYLSPDKNMSNKDFVNQNLTNGLLSSFPNLTVDQIQKFLVALMQTYTNVSQFTGVLEDFLAQTKEIGGNPDDFVYSYTQQDS